MKIGEAVEAMHAGTEIARAGWNGKGMAIFFVTGAVMPDGTAIEPFYAIRNPAGRVYPWNASQQDLLADDYEVARP